MALVGAGSRGSGPARAAVPEEDQCGCLENQRRVRALLTSTWFDVSICGVIALNAAAIGLEQSMNKDSGSPLAFKVFESVFLVVYIIELGLRVFSSGLAAFKDPWVKLDLFLVGTGVLSSWLMEPLLSANVGARPFVVFRTVRLLRLVKTARLFARIREFSMMIRSILNSSGIMLCTLTVLFLIMYVFSCLGVEIITKHRLYTGAQADPEFREHAELYFGSLPRTMLTLLQFVCLDNMDSVYRPLIDFDPWLALYFVSIILTISVVLMNLVAAVIFNCTMEQNSHAQDLMKKAKDTELAKWIRDLKCMFERLDQDKSGQITRGEIANIEENDQTRLCQALGVTTPFQLFQALDVDGNGEVSIDEFFDGILDCVRSGHSVGLKRIEKHVETMYWRLKETFCTQHEIKMAVDKITVSMEDLKSSHQFGTFPAGRGTETQSELDRTSTSLGKEANIRLPQQAEAPAWVQDLSDRLQSSWEESLERALKQMRTEPSVSNGDQTGRRLTGEQRAVVHSKGQAVEAMRPSRDAAGRGASGSRASSAQGLDTTAKSTTTGNTVATPRKTPAAGLRRDGTPPLAKQDSGRRTRSPNSSPHGNPRLASSPKPTLSLLAVPNGSNSGEMSLCRVADVLAGGRNDARAGSLAEHGTPGPRTKAPRSATEGPLNGVRRL